MYFAAASAAHAHYVHWIQNKTLHHGNLSFFIRTLFCVFHLISTILACWVNRKTDACVIERETRKEWVQIRKVWNTMEIYPKKAGHRGVKLKNEKKQILNVIQGCFGSFSQNWGNNQNFEFFLLQSNLMRIFHAKKKSAQRSKNWPIFKQNEEPPLAGRTIL